MLFYWCQFNIRSTVFWCQRRETQCSFCWFVLTVVRITLGGTAGAKSCLTDVPSSWSGVLSSLVCAYSIFLVFCIHFVPMPLFCSLVVFLSGLLLVSPLQVQRSWWNVFFCSSCCSMLFPKAGQWCTEREPQAKQQRYLEPPSFRAEPPLFQRRHRCLQECILLLFSRKGRFRSCFGICGRDTEILCLKLVFSLCRRTNLNSELILVREGAGGNILLYDSTCSVQLTRGWSIPEKASSLGQRKPSSSEKMFLLRLSNHSRLRPEHQRTFSATGRILFPVRMWGVCNKQNVSEIDALPTSVM